MLGPVFIDLSSGPGAKARGSLGTGFRSGLPGLPLQAQRESAFSNQPNVPLQREDLGLRGGQRRFWNTQQRKGVLVPLPPLLFGMSTRVDDGLSLTAEHWPVRGLPVPSASSW